MSYTCPSCGADAPARSGRCPRCGVVTLPAVSATVPTLPPDSSQAATLPPEVAGAVTLPLASGPQASRGSAARAEVGPLAPGQSFGRRYHIKRLLGLGGM